MVLGQLFSLALNACCVLSLIPMTTLREQAAREWVLRLGDKVLRLGDKRVIGAPSLEEIVEVLNDRESDASEFLRRLVQRWSDSGWNLRSMLQADVVLYAELQNLWEISYQPAPGPSKGAVLLPIAAGGAYSKSKPGVLHSEYLAMMFFGTLTLRDWEKLGGPCARCGNFYVKRRASQKVYCSRRCGNASTATARTAEQRVRERAANLERAKKTIQQWQKAGSQQPDWKEFVSKKTGLTPKWLTRAVRNYGLRAPHQGGL
jgi:hypothetical protein